MVQTRAGNKPKQGVIEIPDEAFEVERILDMKENCGKTFYLIKWKNYSKNWNTWEPKENLENCPLMIKKFERQKLPKPLEGKINFDLVFVFSLFFPFCRVETSFKEDINAIPTISSQSSATVEVLGVVRTLDSFFFLSENPKTKRLSLVERNDANKNFPQAVIDFYEAHHRFVHIKNEKE